MTCPHRIDRQKNKCSKCDLQDSINREIPKARPVSMVPRGFRSKRSKHEEPVPVHDIREIGLPSAIMTIIQRKVARVAEINTLISSEIREKKRLSEEIKSLCNKHELVGKIAVEGNVLNYYKTQSKKITKESMLEAGFTPANIAAATKVDDQWNLRITLPGLDEEEEYG